MSQAKALTLCRIVAPERLTDRFMASGVLFQKESRRIQDQVMLAYIFEINKPWFPSSKVIPSLIKVLAEQHRHLTASPTLPDQFEQLLRSINTQLGEISESGETDWIGNMNGLILVIGRDEIHFSQTGHCPTYLLQSNKIRQISDDTDSEREPHPLKTFTNLASGNFGENDQLLVANPELYREISLDALRRIMHSSSPYHACQAITRELKKEKNPAISALIVRATDQEERGEPEEILLEEELQSQLRKIQKQLQPVWHHTKKAGITLAKLTQKGGQQAGELIKTRVAPKASALLKQGAESLQSHTKKNTAAVEIIPPKAERERQQQLALAQDAEDRADLKYIPTNEQIEEESVTVSELQTTTAVSTLPPWRVWLSKRRNQKNAAIILAACLLTLTIGGIAARRRPHSITANQNQNTQLLQDITTLEQKISSALTLKQEVEASREISQAENTLNNLKDPTDAQKKEADDLWTKITAQADSLSKTQRFSAPVANYHFSQPSLSLLTSLPYFYGYASEGNSLLRTGTDNSQSSSALPSSTDSIISFTHSSETDAVGYLLTKQNKVFRVTQNGGDSFLHPVTPASGDFASGDVIGSYIGNIYLLDGKTGLLWKYLNNGNGYNKGVSVIDINKYDIKKSLSLAIDGSIYLLKQDGSLLKFTSGVQESDFSLHDIPTLAQRMIQPLQVITNESMSSIYILDAGLTSTDRSSARILEFNKSGSFIHQYAFPKDYTKVHGFDIDPQGKKLWVVNASEIDEFNL